MIGPSPYVLINMGSRYQPCMHTMPNVQNATDKISWPCPNATSTTGDSVTCSLSDLCGFSGVPNPHVGGDLHDSPAPNQWWRFIVPIFLHAGIIHIGFNLLLQMTLGRDVELLIGSIRFALVYFASGIFGFVLGGNFAASGISSCGCSGSMFGILAITLLDLLYTWKDRSGPIKDLLFIGVDVLIAFVLGLLPGLDNFSHIGGFLMGLVLGICILRSPSAFTRRPAGDVTRPVRYSGVSMPVTHAGPANDGITSFVKSPLAFFQHRRGIWWGWWVIRALMLVGCLVAFILLLKNFYVWRTTCSWCKYLSCLDVTVGNTKWVRSSLCLNIHVDAGEIVGIGIWSSGKFSAASMCGICIEPGALRLLACVVSISGMFTYISYCKTNLASYCTIIDEKRGLQVLLLPALNLRFGFVYRIAMIVSYLAFQNGNHDMKKPMLYAASVLRSHSTIIPRHLN
nr:putative rhomboid protein [Quercus suber]